MKNRIRRVLTGKEGTVDMKARKLTVVMLSAGMATALSACGASSASHLVEETTVPSAPTTTVAAGTSTTTSATGATTPTTTTPSGTFSANTLNQVAAELGSLDSTLSTADNDLNDPQGDS